MPAPRLASCLLAAALCGAPAAPAQAEPAPVIVVHNPAPVPQTGPVRGSLPLPRGRWRALPEARVAGQPATALPLLRWPDGSLALVQLHWQVAELPAGAWQELAVELRAAPESPAEVGPAEVGPAEVGPAEVGPAEVGPAKAVPPPAPVACRWTTARLPFCTELEDPWGRVYQARFEPDPSAGPEGFVRRSPALQLRRYRALHRRGPHALLNVLAYVESRPGSRRAVLSLVLDNAAYSSGPVLGPVRFKRFSLCLADQKLRSLPRNWRELGIPPPVSVEGGGSRIDLLPSSDQNYLGDRSAKCFRIELFADDPGLSAAARQAAARAVRHPILALPGLDWTRHTRAFSAHGGPGPGPQRPDLQAAWLRRSLELNRDVGAYASFGRGRDPAAQGTPHNGPMVLHNVLRLADPALLRHAEAMVLQHSLQPTPGLPTRLPKASAALRQRMSEAVMDAPHGFHRMDYEHFAVGLLYDFYWLTGDPLAQLELRRMGEGLRAVLAKLPFFTCRGEGWCLQSGVLIARAGGDAALLEFLDTRFKQQVLPKLSRPGAPSILAQPGHRDAFGKDEPFDAPWQMAALVHGLHAMWVQTADPLYARLARRVADVMAGPAWLEGKGPKYLVHAHQPGRYRMPVGHGPLEGTAWMQLGAFVLAREMSEQGRQRERYGARIRELQAAWEGRADGLMPGNPWWQLYLDRGRR